MNNKKALRSNLLLVLTALIWGFSFVAQSEGNDIGSFTFNASRSFVAGVVLLPVIAMFDALNKKQGIPKEAGDQKTLIIGGIACGSALFVASAFQQIGIGYTTVGKAGFITTLYILIVPFFGIFMKKKVPLAVWISVVVAAVGMYLLCVTEEFTIGKGDLLILCCAFCYAIHILVIDHFSPLVDGVRMSCIQFFTCGILSAIAMFAVEEPNMKEILSAWLPICYAGALSAGVGYTLQIIAQKNTNPTMASLIMSLESVFAVLAGWLLLGQALTAKELFGCALVFAAVLFTQLAPEIPDLLKKKKA
ncbi:MAG: DMT family transporter [Clostridiales bacterium]|nr:DMT family transporter [Clostridiales bacterium]